LATGQESGMSFTDVERDYLRRKLVPDFEWTTFVQPSEPVPLGKPVGACRVALVVTSGAYVAASQPRFDIQNPLGDDTFRVISSETAPSQIMLAHPGYDTRRSQKDLDTVFPYQLLSRLCAAGAIGEVALRHVSFMGYIPRTERLLRDRAPQVAQLLKEDGVDLAILVPS
jgi:D-proline reductase (dithiol) PrdB